MTCDDLSLINNTQKTLKPSQKMFQFPGWMRKKPHNWEFQLKGIGGNMRCKLLQKRSTGKTTEPLNGGGGGGCMPCRIKKTKFSNINI